MKMLVTGASGFIGCRLAEILAGLGHDLVATGRAESDVEKGRIGRLLNAGIIVQTGSLLDDEGNVAAAPELRSQIVGQSQVIPGRPRGVASCQDKVYECTLNIIYLCRGPNVGGPGVNQLAVKCLEDKR